MLCWSAPVCRWDKAVRNARSSGRSDPGGERRWRGRWRFRVAIDQERALAFDDSENGAGVALLSSGKPQARARRGIDNQGRTCRLAIDEYGYAGSECTSKSAARIGSAQERGFGNKGFHYHPNQNVR